MRAGTETELASVSVPRDHGPRGWYPARMSECVGLDVASIGATRYGMASIRRLVRAATRHWHGESGNIHVLPFV